MSNPIFVRKVLWILMTLFPIAVCCLLYAAYASELMVDFFAFAAYSLAASTVCITLLLILRRIDASVYKRKKWARIWVIFFGTPVIHALTWLYFTLFVMSFQWSQSIVGDYNITKYQNLLSAKFYYCDEKGKNDTLVITVNRYDKIKSVAKINLGEEISISEKNIDSNKALLKLNILKYKN